MLPSYLASGRTVRQMSSEMLAIIFGLSSAIIWGAGDFTGALASKRGNVLTVILFSQLVGFLPLLVLGWVFAETAPTVEHLVWGACAGLGGGFGLVFLYAGLALGRMGIVAPLSAVVTTIIPVGVGFFFEGVPGLSHIVGFGAALVAVWLLSSTEDSANLTRIEVYFSVLAGLGFGMFLTCMGHVSETAIIWPMVAARISSMALMLTIIASKGPRALPTGRQMPFIAAAGLLDVTGNVMYALACQVGRLDVSAVLAALYPASTVMLAWLLLKERLRARQWVGVLAAITCLVLIAG